MVAVTLTVLAPPSSAMVVWAPTAPVSASTEIVIAPGAASSSVMESVAGVMVRLSDVVPVTLMVSFASSRTSLVGVRSKVPDLLASPAAMMMSKLDTAS